MSFLVYPLLTCLFIYLSFCQFHLWKCKGWEGDKLIHQLEKQDSFGAIFASADIEKALQNRPIHQYWDAFLLEVVLVKKACAALDHL